MRIPTLTRNRRRFGVATTLAVGALVAGAVPTIAQAVAASPNTSGTYVSSNRIHTASFEYWLKPWSGTNLAHQRWATPDGHWVARVTATTDHAVLDDWPGDATNTVRGWTYTASILVATATGRNWNTTATLVLREHTRSGTYVASREVSKPLLYRFQQLSVSMQAVNAGDYMDLYVYQSGVPRGSSFVADQASLVYSHPVSTTPTPPTSPPPPPPPSNSPSTLGLLANATGQADALGDTSRYAYVVLQEDQYAHIPAIKRMNPNTKVLAYMESAGTQYRSTCTDSTSPHLPGDSYGVSYCWAAKYHPDLFLTDSAGNRLHASDYPNLVAMDVGNPLYAATWAQGSYANISKDGFDGVFMDDVNIYPGHGWDGRIAKYSDEQYGTATTSFASTVGDYFRSRGMLAIANVGMDPWTSWMLDDTLALAKHVTAVNREHFVRYGDICGPFSERFSNVWTSTTPPLSPLLTETRLLQSEGAKFTAMDYGYTTPTSDDVATMTYGRALFLLTWDGSAGSAYFFRPCGAVDPAAAQWTVDIGEPTGPMQTESGGLLVRNFQHGVVILNPNRGGSALRASVPAGLHPMSGATEDGGVSVAPETAAILSS